MKNKAVVAQAILREKDLMYMKLFQCREGQFVLKDLIALFAPDKIVGETPHETTVRAATSDPIRYIQRRIQNGMEG